MSNDNMFRMIYPFIILAVFSSLLTSHTRGDVILDNELAAPVYKESGSWATSSGTGYNNGTYRYTTQEGAFATWRPYLSHDRRCEVCAVFRTGSNRADNASYTITHAHGATGVRVSQYSSSTSVEEVSLGQYDFKAGTEGCVRLDALTSGKVYIADAIIFRSFANDPPMIFPVSQIPTRPMKWNKVLVTAVITDDDGIASATLSYTTMPSSATYSLQAFDDGAHGDLKPGDSLYGARIPAQDDATSVTYSFMARDTMGQVTSGPEHSYTVYSKQFPEFRAIWSASWWTGFLNREQADDLVATCRENNINTLLPEVRKIGDAYYDSTIEPRAGNISGGPDYDPLGYVLQVAHDTSGGKKRLQVHAWFCMHRIWMNASGELPSGHILLEHPEYEMIKYDGTRDPDSRWLDPGHPGAGEHNLAVILDCLAGYDLDGVHFDYVRYRGGKEFGYNPVSVERFNTLYGRRGIPDPTDAQWSDWRRECVSLEVKKIYVHIRKQKPEVLLSAATQAYGNYNNFQQSGAYTSCFQDWVSWLHEGFLDYNIIMNYKSETDRDAFEGWVDRSLAEDEGRGSIIGVSGASNTTIQGVMDQLLYSRSQGADGMNIFSWMGEVSGNIGGETREQFYSELKSQVYPTWVEPPDSPWKANPTTGIFEGRVTFQAEPVDHAGVWIQGRPETRTVTDGAGWYGILNLPPGEHKLHFAKQGFREAMVSSSIPKPGDVVTINVALEKITTSGWLAE